MLGPPRHRACHIRVAYGELATEFKQSETLGRVPARFRSYRSPKPCTIFPQVQFRVCNAMIWYVNSKLNSGTSDGRSLQTAFASLQQALDHAKAGDTILIAPGAYDQDLAARVSTARAANIIVGVVGA